jgi:DNA-binding transcriptional regulator YiaG
MPSRKKKRTRRTLEQQLADLMQELDDAQEQVRTRERFTPEKLAAHRAKLELSAADYGELIGVSALTIYNWEKGKTQPRSTQIDSWIGIRSLGKREAWKKLGYE